MKFTTDQDLIQRCIKTPHVWRNAGFDKGIDPDFYWVPEIDDAKWIDTGYGLIMLIDQGQGSFEVHLSLMTSARGLALFIAARAIKFAFAELDANRFIASIPKDNHLANRMAVKSGFELGSTDEKNFNYILNRS